jgi:hypothetical protein
VNGLAYGSRVLHLVYDLVVIDAVVEVMVDDGDDVAAEVEATVDDSVDVVAVSVDSSYNHSTPCYNQVLYHIEIMNMNYMS